MRRLFTIHRDERGSAMLMVVIAMLFIVALGTALLSASYLTLTVSTAERGSGGNFYNASKALDDIKLGLQKDCSASASDACTDTLTAYAQGKLENASPQSTCTEKYKTLLIAVKVSNSTGTNSAQPLFTVDGTSTTCNAAALKNYLATDVADKLTISPASINVAAAYDGTALKSLTLKDVSLTYTDSGYQTKVSADIVLNIPDFFANSALPSTFKNYSIIAEQGLYNGTTVNAAITGDVYAGANTTSGMSICAEKGGRNSGFTFTGGNVVCASSIATANTADGSTIIFNAPGKELWAKSINVGAPASTININGDVRVAGDLSVTNTNSKVTLAGKYFGFGNDTTVAEKSSAVLIGGKNTTLDLSGLKNFTLAGVSFISNVGDDKASIPMGQSVATKPDQLAYLLPAECLNNYPTNPYYSEKNIVECQADPNPNYVLWNGKTLSDYTDDKIAGEAGKNANAKVTTYRKSFDQNDKSYYIFYTFIVFKNQKTANEYFIDYYKSNPAAVLNYVNQYLSTSSSLNAAGVLSRGTTYKTGTQTDGNSGAVLNPSNAVVSSAFMSQRYAELSQSPFNKFVDENEYQAVLGTLIKSDADSNPIAEYKDSSGKVVAVVVNGDYTYNGSSDSPLKLIIASGNVTVSQKFEGLIIANGTVNANADIISGASSLQSLTGAKYGDHVLGSLIRIAGNADNSSGSSNWTSDTLVQYSNWKKNG